MQFSTWSLAWDSFVGAMALSVTIPVRHAIPRALRWGCVLDRPKAWDPGRAIMDPADPSDRLGRG